ncbi:hypothetical protein DFH06DRAFT_1364192 [Mycena polygramma]|nr:hypothetical protein DFH06DRAFT_1364192 [Mycena polygramma]
MSRLINEMRVVETVGACDLGQALSSVWWLSPAIVPPPPLIAEAQAVAWHPARLKRHDLYTPGAPARGVAATRRFACHVIHPTDLPQTVVPWRPVTTRPLPSRSQSSSTLPSNRSQWPYTGRMDTGMDTDLDTPPSRVIHARLISYTLAICVAPGALDSPLPPFRPGSAPCREGMRSIHPAHTSRGGVAPHAAHPVPLPSRAPHRGSELPQLPALPKSVSRTLYAAAAILPSPVRSVMEVRTAFPALRVVPECSPRLWRVLRSSSAPYPLSIVTSDPPRDSGGVGGPAAFESFPPLLVQWRGLARPRLPRLSQCFPDCRRGGGTGSVSAMRLGCRQCTHTAPTDPRPPRVPFPSPWQAEYWRERTAYACGPSSGAGGRTHRGGYQNFGSGWIRYRAATCLAGMIDALGAQRRAGERGLRKAEGSSVVLGAEAVVYCGLDLEAHVGRHVWPAKPWLRLQVRGRRLLAYVSATSVYLYRHAPPSRDWYYVP